MLDKIKQLYLQGKLNGGLFRKVAEYIVEQELEKIAQPPLTPEQAQLLGKLMSSVSEKFGPDVLARQAGKWQQMVSGTPAEAEKLIEYLKSSGAPGLAEKILSFIQKNKLLTGLVAVPAMWGASGLIHAGKDFVESQRQNSTLESILESNPDLDEEKARKNFEALKEFAPTIASNEAAAEGILKQRDQWDYLDQASLQGLSQIEKNVQSGERESSLSKVLSDLGKSLGSLLAFGD